MTTTTITTIFWWGSINLDILYKWKYCMTMWFAAPYSTNALLPGMTSVPKVTNQGTEFRLGCCRAASWGVAILRVLC